MKSKILKLKDYREIPFEKEIIITGIEEQIASDIRHLVRKDKKRVEGEKIEKGDVVLLNITSDNTKFNKKNLSLSVGAGLFDEDLETSIIGLEKSDGLAEITVGDSKVFVEIKSIVRNIFPELSDKHVVAWAESEEGDKSIRTADDFVKAMHKKHFDEQREDMLFSTVLTLMENVFEQSEWDFDEEEITKFYNLILSEVDEELAAEGKTWDDLTEKDYNSFFGVSNKEETLRSIRNSAEEHFVHQLLACYYTNTDTNSINVDDEPPMNVYDEYKSYIEQLVTVKEG